MQRVLMQREVPAGWKLLLDADDLSRAVKKCATALDELLGDRASASKPVVVICVLKGAVYFHVDLTRALRTPHSQLFVQAASYAEGQERGKLTLTSPIPADKVKGRRVVVLDELYDSGETLRGLKEHLVGLGAEPDDIILCTLMVKSKRTSPKLTHSGSTPVHSFRDLPDIYGVVTPDVWLVGCGLDDQQEKRNWSEVWAVPKTPGLPLGEDDKLFSSDEAYGRAVAGLREQLGHE